MKRASLILLAALLGLLAFSAIVQHMPPLYATIDNDENSPTTTLIVGEPKSFDGNGTLIVSSLTPITLSATDNEGSTDGVSTTFRIYSSTYDTGWKTYSAPFYITGPNAGQHYFAYYSTDRVGNLETTRIVPIIIAVQETPVQRVNLSTVIPTVLVLTIAAGMVGGVTLFFIAEADLIRRRRRKKEELDFKVSRPPSTREKR